ncbi:unnamed protein product [Brassica rapa]|uniref:FHA domain-containing protein n=1 Tax=Brassica campestris TaxID=3711 RepID=A0A8D9CWM4_BRACM|nr:unnamed protein product [Brassica rapa]
MEKQQVREKRIPVFTVLKKGAILKNIFVVNSRDLSSHGKDDAEAEEILLVGRHPDCDILLTHPSISRYHLQIRSLPSRQKLFLTDLSSVHGTWVADQKVEPDACVEVKEGDVIRIGGSTRIYSLHWIPLSRAYDIDVSPLHASTQNLEVAHQHQSQASAEDGDGHLDVTSEGSGSSVPSEDEDTYSTTTAILVPLFSSTVLTLPRDSVNTQMLQRNDDDFQTSSKWDLDLVEAAAERPSRSCGLSKQQSGSYVEEVLGCYELELADERNVRGDEEGLLLNVMSEVIESSVPVEEEEEDPYLSAKETSSLPVPRDYYIGTENLQITDEVQAESTSSGSLSLAQIDDGCFEAAGCQAFELAAEAETMRPFQEVNGETAEHQAKAEIQSHVYNGELEVSGQDIAVSPRSSPQGKQLIEMLTEDAQGLLGSQYGNEVSIETDTENLHEIGNDGRSTWHSEDLEQSGLRSFLLTPTQKPRTELLNAPESTEESFILSKIKGEGNTGKEVPIPWTLSTETFEDKLLSDYTGDQENQTQRTLAVRDDVLSELDISRMGTATLFPALFSCSCDFLAAKVCCRTVLCVPDPVGSQSFQLLPRLLILSSTASVVVSTVDCITLNHVVNQLLCILLSSSQEEPITSCIQSGPVLRESTTVECAQQALLRETMVWALSLVALESLPGFTETFQALLLKAGDLVSQLSKICKISSTSNIWSRRGKDASVLQVKTNKSEGKQKQIGKQAKAHLQRKALSGRSIYLTVDHGAYKLEPDIFTPDKENLTPNSHMLRRLREVGEIKDTKSSSSKAMRKPFFDIHVEENLLAQQKPEVHCMSSNSKVKQEPVALKKKAERAPFQPLLEKSSSQSQSYSEAPSTASARNNISRGVRSSSNLSDGKNKMKWTIVLDTSSLLDKDSRKTLHLLQGLKGTHLVVPRTVIRELNETKRTRNVLFRRTVDMASSALDWIEECQVNSKWWIELQSPLEETKATAPTPPVTPQSNGFAFPFSLQWNNYAPEIDSPTSEDEVLECALLYRNRNNIDEKLVLLSNDITLKIKAMLEGVICETALEFYESLKNPLSERFMWPESLPRGRTWSHADDVVLRERYDSRTCFPYRKKPTFNGGRREESGAAAAAKGLKLILLHNSQYGHIH